MRTGRIAAAMLAAFLIAGSRSAAQADSTWREHEQALQAARAAHDTTAYRAQLAAIHRTIGATPRIAARFAALALGQHDRKVASRWMGALATMGVALDSTMLAQYAMLEGAQAREAVLAQRARATSDLGSPEVVFGLPDPNMIAEDLAYDVRHTRWLVSSVRRGGIYAKQKAEGGPAVVAFSADSSWGILGIGVDTARGVLWAVTAALPMGARYSASDSGRSTLLEFDLSTGALRARYPSPDSGAHAFGDLTVGANGAVYVADGLGSGVYVLDAGSSALRTLVAPGILISPQTPALSSDGATLFVPDYAVGIAAVTVATGAITWLVHSDLLALTGIDGMYRVGHDIIAVQNGLEPNRITRLTLDASMRRVVRAATIVRGAKARELTHASISNGWLYFLRRSGWDRVADDGTMTEANAADGPEVVRVRIIP